MTRDLVTVAVSLTLILLGAGAGGAAAARAASPVAGLSAPVFSSHSAGVSPVARAGATRGLRPAQRRARHRALRNCRRIKVRAKRQRCLRRVDRRYRRKANGQEPQLRPAVPTAVHEVLLTDNTSDAIQSSYFIPLEDIQIHDGVIDQPPVPARLEIRPGEAVRFVWDDGNRDSSHQIGLWKYPSRVNPWDFSFSAAATLGVAFQRTFAVPGQYEFRCSLHHLTQILELTVAR